ncbi:UbiA family prenyltransferase [Kiritimatiellaeota bacterium B1221]|nr:UbiA family prenyltransferase [Kiritimatiellaeota bacterium B1221]
MKYIFHQMTRPLPQLPPLLQLLRPHQWSKNVLLFFPVVLAHRISEWPLLLTTAVAAGIFSLLASAVYVINDYLDVEADRQHPEKKNRPLAAGTVPLSWAPFIGGGLGLVALTLAFTLLPPMFGGVLLAYLLANLAYSSLLKHIPILDAVFLTLMFVARIYAGGVAGEIPVSVWLLTFCLFFFLSIAFAKRVQELQMASENVTLPTQNTRGYRTQDLPCISQLGVGSGLISVLVLALYMKSDEMIHQYKSPLYLWLLCPLMLFWIGRFWLVTFRGQMSHDPILFTLKDKVSYIVLITVMAVIQIAHWV